ncbi:hypothetical protein OH797_19255 [Streptomyces anulatus]|uniref:hypothetical protein n=1 Tax=Streptomyces TaxID=1883 RepID=UPI000B065C6B|nr:MULTISPECIES: hypothetical protein [Streptomyces]MDF9805100.1 hypothetical protein [Streptomyces sp. HB372]MBT1099469.1 hypothetical protein [Streptomyces sp. Tu10]WSC62647.1 hypothetical protein OHA57_18795 [Streptomyces anulatus]WSR77031.1 hypothetical protein OG274_18205 [Streptomyces anulatus]WTC64636.1 hypothetical protein OG865_19680 [Streptomyces anulatus]
MPEEQLLQNRSIEMLHDSLVELLMAIIGAPDDETLARDGDAAVKALDARLRAEPGRA